MTWLSQRKNLGGAGGGEARERTAAAAARRSQRLGPSPVLLSAPRGCESAAAAAAEESVGRRLAGGTAEDEAAAGRSRRGGGRRAVVGAPAARPGGRARAHGERRRGPEARAAGRERLPVGPGRRLVCAPGTGLRRQGLGLLPLPEPTRRRVPGSGAREAPGEPAGGVRWRAGHEVRPAGKGAALRLPGATTQRKVDASRLPVIH